LRKKCRKTNGNFAFVLQFTIEWQREKPLYSGFLDICEKFLGKFLGVCAAFLIDMM